MMLVESKVLVLTFFCFFLFVLPTVMSFKFHRQSLPLEKSTAKHLSSNVSIMSVERSSKRQF